MIVSSWQGIKQALFSDRWVGVTPRFDSGKSICCSSFLFPGRSSELSTFVSIRAIFHVHFQTHIKTIQLFVFLPVLQEFPRNLCCRRYQQILTDGMTQKVVEWKVNRIGEEKGACMWDVALFYLQEVNIRFILTIPICYPANICWEQTNISFLSRIFFPLPFYTENRVLRYTVTVHSCLVGKFFWSNYTFQGHWGPPCRHALKKKARHKRMYYDSMRCKF